MKIIILEGCDKVGKSTFSEMLARELKGEVIVWHSGKPDQKTGEELARSYVSILEDLSSLNPDYLIMERSYWGNLIYAPLYRQTKLTHEQVYALHETFARHCEKIFYVLLTAPEELVRERFKSENEEMIKEKHIAKILKGFSMQYYFVEEVMPHTTCIKIDTSLYPLNQLSSHASIF